MTLHKLLVGFNFSLFVALFFSAVLPYIILGTEALDYYHNSIYGIGIMLASFIGINIYFRCNWVLFRSLEHGDWNVILYLLREKIFEQENYSKKYIFYYIEVAIQLNNLELLRELHEELSAKAEQQYPASRLSMRSLQNLQGLQGVLRCWQWRFWERFPRRSQGKSQRNYAQLSQQARLAQKRLCDFAIELGLVYLIEEPGQGSELYFGGLRESEVFRQNHKYNWAELFYAIALLVQGKQVYGAMLLEQLLLPELQQSKRESMFYSSSFRKIAQRVSSRFRELIEVPKARHRALLQLLSIQLLEDLQDSGCVEIDRQLVNLRRMEIQRIYGSAKNWASCLAREQSQNVAIVMIQQLIDTAYEKQLRPALYMPQAKKMPRTAVQPN